MNVPDSTDSLSPPLPMPERPRLPAAPRPPWNFWSTFGLGLLAMGVMVLSQAAVAIIFGIVLMQKLERTMEVVTRVRAAVERINTDGSLPLGVKIATGYNDPTAQILLIPATLAGALLFTLPAVLAFLALQKKLTRGIVTTGLKG